MNLYKITDDLGKTRWIVAENYGDAERIFENKYHPRNAVVIEFITGDVTIQAGQDYIGGIG